MMNSDHVKQSVKAFRREFGLKRPDAEDMINVFERQGFTVIPFNPVLNDPDVDTVIHSLHLNDLIRHMSGFIYTNQNFRLVFVNEKLTDEERLLVLAHEEGHYYCGHTNAGNVIGRNVSEEFEANEFAHYLLQGTIGSNVKSLLSKHRKITLAFLAALAIVGGGTAAAQRYRSYQESKLYEGEYYVSMHGTKFHLKNCVTIQGHEIRRLKKEDVEAGIYEPCSVCLPDKA